MTIHGVVNPHSQVEDGNTLACLLAATGRVTVPTTHDTIPAPDPQTWHAHPGTLAYGYVSDSVVLVVVLVVVVMVAGVAYLRGERSLLRKYRRRTRGHIHSPRK